MVSDEKDNVQQLQLATLAANFYMCNCETVVVAVDETRGLRRSADVPKTRSIPVYQQHVYQKDSEAVFWIFSGAHFCGVFEQKKFFVPKPKRPEHAVRSGHQPLIDTILLELL